MEEEAVRFGDLVRIRRAPETVAAGFADRVGICLAAAPTLDPVIGEGDEPIRICFEDSEPAQIAWFDATLVQRATPPSSKHPTRSVLRRFSRRRAA